MHMYAYIIFQSSSGLSLARAVFLLHMDNEVKRLEKEEVLRMTVMQGNECGDGSWKLSWTRKELRT